MNKYKVRKFEYNEIKLYLLVQFFKFKIQKETQKKFRIRILFWNMVTIYDFNILKEGTLNFKLKKKMWNNKLWSNTLENYTDKFQAKFQAQNSNFLKKKRQKLTVNGLIRS